MTNWFYDDLSSLQLTRIYQGNTCSRTITSCSLINFYYCMESDVTSQCISLAKFSIKPNSYYFFTCPSHWKTPNLPPEKKLMHKLMIVLTRRGGLVCTGVISNSSRDGLCRRWFESRLRPRFIFWIKRNLRFTDVCYMYR